MRWYGQQLDTDERIARACAGNGEWKASDIKVYGPELSVAVRAHMAEHDPARVLREIDSKRRLLAHYIKAAQAVEELTATRERLRLRGQDLLMTEMELESAIHRRDTLHGVVCVLAAVYADREGYEEGWAP